jgi:S-formylglutathione hydrolase
MLTRRLTIAAYLILPFLVACGARTQSHEGRVVFSSLHSKSLEKNLLGDPAELEFTVYFPPSYEDSPTQRYPVVYLLHGNGGNEQTFIDGTYQGLNIKTAMDAAIDSGTGREFLIVMPGSNTRYSGSHYANSSVSGGWADAITRELVEHVDKTYRTIPRPASRGLAGHSMGGRGTLFLAATVPGVYGAIYALSPGAMAFESFPPIDDATWQAVLTSADAAQASPSLRRAIGFAVAYSPNPSNPPLFADFPVEIRDGQVRRIDSVWAKWIAHDPIALIPERAGNLRLLSSIHFSCGTDDPFLPQNRLMTELLRKAGLEFTYEEYAGDHISKIREQIETSVIPMFSSSLVFE